MSDIVHVVNKLCVRGEFIALAFLMLVAVSCQEDCDFTPVSKAGAGLYTISNNQEVKKNADSLYVYPLELPDSIIYSWTKNVNFIRLPLNPLEDQSSFVVRINEFIDTLEIHYERQLYFVSEACGFSVNFKILAAYSSLNGIDSVHIMKPKIGSVNEEHLRIYF